MAFMVATVGGAQLGSAVLARHRAQAAADLAALAAAGALPSGPEFACARGRNLATAMATAVVDCQADGLDVIVRVEAPAMLGVARAAARAGPVTG
ncbi:helicase [Mycobacterium sp. ACS4331]|nr:helicase [Mycobacterium sp. ACS4331]